MERIDGEQRTMRTTTRYVAEVNHVREVSLLGSADLAFWRERLSAENLFPAERDGKAQVLIVGATMRFMGIRFTEISFSVLLSGHEEAAGQTGAFLFQAFNSSRLFAWCERVFFATPYLHAHCPLCSSPFQFNSCWTELAFRAEMQADAKTPQRQSLASRRRNLGRACFSCRGTVVATPLRSLLLCEMKGQTAAYPFVRATDALFIKPSQEPGILRALLDSGFTGEEWVVRKDATHGKSKTYARSDLIAR
jgi:hypothetical protein